MGILRKLTWTRGLAALLALGLASVFFPRPGYVPPGDVARTLLLLARAATLLLVPGLALVLLLRPFDDLDMLQTIVLGVITSLALFPLLLFWVGLFGGRWSPWLVRLFLVLCAALIIWRLGRPARPWLESALPSTVALAAIFLLALATRLYLIKGIPYPAWVDSYHHTIITQVTLDTGRVPLSYRPYADLDGFVYHFGFHAGGAFVAWVTGLAAHRAVLWGGQVLNALTVLSVFFFVDRVGRDRRGALVACVVAGLVCRMPSYYVNFGRYPQLAGQVLLPVALGVAVDACTRRKSRWSSWLLGGILVGGLGITHYRVAIFCLAGLVVLVLAGLVRERFDRRRFLSVGSRLLALGFVALILTWPWLPSLLDRTISLARRAVSDSKGVQYDYITLDFVRWAGLRQGMLIAAAVAAVWLLFRVRQVPLGALVLLWLGIVTFLANPAISGTPSGFMSNGAVLLALYLPASVLVGLATGDLLSQFEALEVGHEVAVPSDSHGRITGLVLAVALVVLCVWGARDKLSGGLEPWRYFVSNSDLDAMAWIGENTPPDAVFVVGAEFWLSSNATGNDAGYWLPYIARRRTILPPMTYTAEGEPDYVAKTNTTVHSLINAGSPAELSAAMGRGGAEYVYVGNRVKQPWQELLTDRRHFEKLYDREGIRIYRRL